MQEARRASEKYSDIGFAQRASDPLLDPVPVLGDGGAKSGDGA